VNQVVGMVLVIGCLWSGATASAAPAQSGAAPQAQRLNACSFLPRPLMEKVTPGPVNKFVFEMKAHEEPVGTAGSACDYAMTALQIDPFARSEEMRRNSPGKDWQGLRGVGDAAYFRNNANRWAEAIVWTGTHHFTIQLSVPDGSTAEAIKPNVIMLANAIVEKLRGPQ
jgi:hypothetical protein